MPKTTLAEIKHLIHKNKVKDEQNISAKNSLELTKVSSEEHSPSSDSSSNDTNKNIMIQNQKVRITDISNDNHAMHFFVSEKDKTSIYEEKFLFCSPPGRKPSISPEYEEILWQVEGIFTIKELSQQFNLPAQALYYWAKKNNYQAKNGNISLSISDELQKKLLSQLNTMSMAELAKENNIPYHTLYYWLKKQGLMAKKSSEFSIHIWQELRKKCETSSLKDLVQEYGLSEQTMRSRLKNIGCFPDGKGGFFIINDLISEEIISCYQKNGINETAERFNTTKTAIKSYLKNYTLSGRVRPHPART